VIGRCRRETNKFWHQARARRTGWSSDGLDDMA